MENLIRRATTTDVPSMAGLLGQLFAIEKDFKADTAVQVRGLELLLAAPNAAVFVAEESGAAVGMATAQLTISTAHGGLSAQVEDVVVKDGRRGRGLGAKLLEAVEAWAGKNGAVRLTLVADIDNLPARKFYGKGGWNQTNLTMLMKTQSGANSCSQAK